MSTMKYYKDATIEFSYPSFCHIETVESAGYYIRRNKKEYLFISVIPQSTGRNLFEQMAPQPSPQPDRTKTVHDHYVLGGKVGRAIVWKIFGPDKQVFSSVRQLFFESGRWSIMIELTTMPPADGAILEQIVQSLAIKT